MQDRYLFRAKRIDTGEWYIGNLVDCPDGRNVIAEVGGNWSLHEVDQSTICQCTGLKKLSEKDIVKRTDIHVVGEPSIGIIEYDIENTAFVIHWIDKEKYSPMYPWKDKIKVIGNIFDNPELLEQEE